MNTRSVMYILIAMNMVMACTLGQVFEPTTPPVILPDSQADQAAQAAPGEAATNPSSPTSRPAQPPDPGKAIQPGDLEYLGAFRLPGESGGSSWDYSGRGLTYYPDGDPSGLEDGFSGSLFGVGHDLQLFVSEITIPLPVISRNIEDLNTAETLQSFADITGGMFPETDIPRMGIQYLPAQAGQSGGKLHFVRGGHIQDFDPSHGWSELTLSDPKPAGPWIFDGYTNYATSDYIFEIPEPWAELIPGKPILVTGRYREGVWSGHGPALFAYNPTLEGNPPEPGFTLKNIIPLMLYGTQEPGLHEILLADDIKMDGHNDDDSWWDGAWLTSGEKSSVIFVGTKAQGESWYGFANGVVWEYDCADKTPPTCPDVPASPYDARGYWAEGYQPQIIFFNPADLVAVARGEFKDLGPAALCFAGPLPGFL